MFALGVSVAPRADDSLQLDKSSEPHDVIQVYSRVPKYQQVSPLLNNAGAHECALKNGSKGRVVARHVASIFGGARCGNVLAFVCDQLTPLLLNRPQLQPAARNLKELIALMQPPLIRSPRGKGTGLHCLVLRAPKLALDVTHGRTYYARSISAVTAYGIAKLRHNAPYGRGGIRAAANL